MKSAISFLIVFQMTFIHPFAFAKDPEANTVVSDAEADVEDTEFSSDSDSLRGAFAALREAAVEAGAATVPEPEVELIEADLEEALAEELTAVLDASDKIEIDLGLPPVNHPVAVIQDFAKLKIEQLPDLDPQDYMSMTKQFLILGQRKAAKELMAHILKKLYPRLDLSRVTISISGSLAPKVRATLNTNDGAIEKIVVSAGAIAFSNSIDELAAQIASKVAETNPKVYGFEDDARFYRELNRAAALWDTLKKTEQDRIKQDLATIEKLVDAGFRAEALNTYERRVNNLFMYRYGKRFWHMLTRRMVGGENVKAYDDELFSTRTDIQEAYLTYIQTYKRGTRESFKALHPFKGKFWRLHKRMRMYTFPFYNSFLHWFGLPLAIGVPHYVKVAFAATTSYLGINFGHLEEVVGNNQIDDIFGKVYAPSENPEAVVVLVTPFVNLWQSLKSGIGSAWNAAGRGISYGWEGLGNFNENALNPYIWSPIGTGVSWLWDGAWSAGGAVVGAIGSVASSIGSGIGIALDAILPDSSPVGDSADAGYTSNDSGYTSTTYTNNDSAYTTSVQPDTADVPAVREQAPLDSGDGYGKLMEYGAEYMTETLIVMSSLALIWDIKKRPEAYKNAAVKVGQRSFRIGVGAVNGLIRGGIGVVNGVKFVGLTGYGVARLPDRLFRTLIMDLRDGVFLNKDLKASEYKGVLEYLSAGLYKEDVSHNLPELITRDVHKNLDFVGRRLFFRVMDHWLLRVKEGKFSIPEILSVLEVVSKEDGGLFRKLLRRSRFFKVPFASRLIEVLKSIKALQDKNGELVEDWRYDIKDEGALREYHKGVFSIENTRYSGDIVDMGYVLVHAMEAAERKDMKTLIHALHYYQDLGKKSAGYKPLSTIFYRILKRELGSMTKFVFSGEVSGEEGALYSEMYADILNASGSVIVDNGSSEVSRIGPQKSKKWFRNVRMALNTARISLGDRNHLIAETSRAGDISNKTGLLSALSVRRVTQRLTKRAVRKAISRLKSVSEIAEWVDKHLTERNADLTSFSIVFYEVLSQNPSLFTSQKDIDALFENSYFWLQLPNDNTNVSKLEEYLVKQLREKAEEFGGVWKYSPAQAEVLHQIVAKKLKEFGQEPKTFEAKLALWLKMTGKGITATTDRLFWSVMESASTAEERDTLEKYALEDGLIWESSIITNLSIDRVKESAIYKELLKHPKNEKRLERVHEFINYVKAAMPNKGLVYMDFLEEVSVEILSTAQEAKAFEDAKVNINEVVGDIEDKRSSSDENVELMKAIFAELYDWSPSQIIDFALYLRDPNREPSKKVKKAFKTVGPERVKRIFETLPFPGRFGALKKLFSEVLFNKEDAEQGLYHKAVRKVFGDAKHMLGDKLIGDKKSPGQDAARKILNAFFHAQDKMGNTYMSSQIMSYLYALPPDAQESPGKTLRHIFEAMGLVFIKFGQKIAATKLLPPEERVHLEDLKENAKPLTRDEIYYDLAGVFNTEPEDLPFEVLELLGSASVKYAVLVKNKETGQKFVIKILRPEAVNNKESQFDLVDYMSEYLVKHYGSDFLMFETLGDSSKQAVEDELSAKGEVAKSKISRNEVYANRSTEDVIVEVPVEEFISERAIMSAYAEGISFDELKVERPEIAQKVAKVIFAIETDVLFGTEEGYFYFEPDRHAGNYRIHYEERADGTVKIFLRPIDMGQLTKITTDLRDKSVKLFALAQILRKAGNNQNIMETVADIHNLDQAARKKLSKHLSDFFPFSDEGEDDEEASRIKAYIAILSAINHSVPEEQKLDRGYIDFVTAMMQVTQYELEGQDEDQMTPARYYGNLVSQKLLEYSHLIEFSEKQKWGLRVQNFMKKTKNAIFGGELNLISEDLGRLIAANVEVDQPFLQLEGPSALSYGEVLQIEDERPEPEAAPLSCQKILSVGR